MAKKRYYIVPDFKIGTEVVDKDGNVGKIIQVTKTFSTDTGEPAVLYFTNIPNDITNTTGYFENELEEIPPIANRLN